VATPTLQLHKEFMADPKYTTWKNELNKTIQDNQTDLVMKAIKGMKDEVKFWEAQLMQQAVEAVWYPVLNAHTAEFTQHSIYIKYVTNPEGGETFNRQTLPAIQCIILETKQDIAMCTLRSCLHLSCQCLLDKFININLA
jgi:hypothetical protein